MKKILLPIIGMLLITGISAQNVIKSRGVPALPKEIEYKQPDGSLVKVVQNGDAAFHWHSTPDGYTLIKNSNGYFEYATNGTTGDLLSSGIRYQPSTLKSSSEQDFFKTAKKNVTYSKKQVDAVVSKSILFSTTTSSSIAKSFPSSGTRKMLIILANFSNTTTGFTQANFDTYANSFESYYSENSYGSLTLNCTVTAWVKLSNTHDYYGPEAKWGQFAYDAIKAADAAGIDFSQFDNDGDGIVDGVAVIHQGTGQESSGNTTDIWSHSWDLTSANYTTTQRTFDGVKVNQYTAQPELLSAGKMSTIGVLCHEFGHNLGLPDFYDTDYSANGKYNGTGDWDLMASGSWNGSPSGSSPAHHNIWSKAHLGWVTPTEITNTNNLTLLNSEKNKAAYKINTQTENEYFLLENRQLEGFDKSLSGHGLIIYHVDGKFIKDHMSTNDINAGSHQGLHPEPANGTINAASCPFPGTAVKNQFTDNTTPNSQTWANGNTLVPLTNIRETNGQILFTATNNNQWIKICSNAGNSTINGWTVRDNDKFYPGDFDGDGDEDLLCTQTGGANDWMTILYFQNGSWQWGWSNYGDKTKGGGIFQYRHNLSVGDFDGDGKDEVLGNDTPSGWITLFHFENNNWQWGWSTSGTNHAILPYRANFVVGDYNGDGKDEILGNALPSGWITMFAFNNNNWQWGWSTYGNNHSILPFRDNLIAGDFDGDGKDEIFGNDIDANGWMTMFDFDNGAFQWGWSNYGSDAVGLNSYRKNLKVGNYDTDGKDEFLGFATWSTAFNYDNNNWQWGWSTYDSNTLYDWPIVDNGLNTKYYFVKAVASSPAFLLAMRKYSSGYSVNMYAYNSGQTSTLKSSQVSDGELTQVNENNVEKLDSEILVYPNPNNGSFTLSLNSETENIAEMSIVDIYGQLVYSQRISLMQGHNEIKISNLSLQKGNYFIKLQGNDFMKTTKINTSND